MKRCLALAISMWMMLAVIPMVSADSYNDDRFDWGEYACPHTHTEEVAEIPSTCIEQGCAGYTRCADCKLPLNGSYDPLPLAEHTYDDVFDPDCNICGAVREALVRGDANSDGKVNNRDLGVLRLYVNEMPVVANVKAMDLDDNGKINNRDLGLLQRMLNQPVCD